jgi:rhomboid protease GluP
VILTYLLLAVIVGVFAVQLILNEVNFPRTEEITSWGALIYYRVLDNNEYYRLFTSMFLHANQVHLLFNALALFSFGRSVEAMFGTGRFGLIYLLGGLAGGVASFIFSRSNVVGASGAIFAIFGAEMIFLFQNRKLLGPSAFRELRSLVILALVNLMLGLVSNTESSQVRIDNWAHIGGFFSGVVLTWFIGPQYRLVRDMGAQHHVKIVDTVLMRNVWLAPLLFAGGMVLAMGYAVISAARL